MSESYFISVLKKCKPYLVLLLLIIIGYWQISFFAFSFKWDMIDVVFPFRYYFSECISAGYFPFWNPYLQTGTPFFSDLQAPTYYPELLIISLFGGYGLGTMHFLFVLYLFIAASGMYRLSFFYNSNQIASLIAGVAYSFSGFIVGHGQHFFLLVGSAWIPFIILNYIKMNRDLKPVYILKAGILLFLMITGAYQALSIVLFYLIILLFLHYAIQALLQKDFGRLKAIIKVNLLLLLMVIVLSTPLLVSTLDILSSVTRFSEGVSLDSAMSTGQSLKSLISLVMPFSTLRNDMFFGGVDISMRNHYFGVIPLIFFIASLFRRRTIPEYLILAFGLIIMAMSFSALPVREFVFKHIPLMDLFVYASYIRVFGLFAFILFSANFIDQFLKNVEYEKGKVIIAGLLVLGILVFLIINAISKTGLDDFSQPLVLSHYSDWLKNLSFHQSILGQGVIHVVIISIFLLSVLYQKKIKWLSGLILILFVVEVFSATQLNIPTTVADSGSKPYRMQKDIMLCPSGFPIPTNNKIVFNTSQHSFYQPFWRNTQIFTRQISFNAFSSFKLNSFSQLDDLYPNLRNAVLNNHLTYFSDEILPLNQFSDSSIDPQKDSRSLYLSEQEYTSLSDRIMAIVKAGEQLSTDSLDEVKIVDFSPNRVSLETKTSNQQFLTLLQTNFKGWNAYIDNQSTPLYTSNFNYRTILLPKGNHVVKFEYRNKKLLILYIISNVLFMITVLFLFGRWIYLGNHKTKVFLIVPLFVLAVILTLCFRCLTTKDENVKMYEAYVNRWSTKDPIYSYQPDNTDEKFTYDSITVFSGEKSIIVDESTEFLTVVELINEDEKLNNGTLVVSAKLFPDSYNNALIVSQISGEDPATGWHGSKIESQIENLNQWNDLFYIRNFYQIKQNESIKVYIWNNGKSSFRIDDIIVNYYD